MERQVKQLIMDYQTLIAEMDKRLAVYEQLGSPEELAAKLKVKLVEVPESKTGNITLKNTTKIIEERRKQAELQERDSKIKEEISNVISKMPEAKSSIVGDINNILAKFKV